MFRILDLAVASLIYLGVLLGTVGLHLGLKSWGWSATASIYLPLTVAAATVTMLERTRRYRAEWSPGRAEVRTDLLYMALVQLALPKLLAVTLGMVVVKALHHAPLSAAVWPGELPWLAQFMLLITGVSFVRYWTHRVCHAWAPLWRLHRVHHSPRRLYWLNLGRFHPGEAAIRFCTELLPLMVLGAPEHLIHLYFVLVAANGLLLHSNVRLRLGALNMIFATAELHRWHHSRDIAESSCNYGNLLIVWDVVFGTYYLPKARQVGELGLAEPDYPQDLVGQLLAPLAPSEARATPRQTSAVNKPRYRHRQATSMDGEAST